MRKIAAQCIMTSKQRITVNVEKGEYAQLRKLARKNHISMAWLGRQAIREFLEKYSQESLQLPLELSATRRASGE